MSGDDDGRSVAGEPLLTRLLRRAGVDRLSAVGWLPEWDPLVWFAAGIVVFELTVLQAGYLVTRQTLSFLGNPLWLVRPVILVAAVLATNALYRRYDRAVERSNLLERTSDPERFRGLTPDWLTVAITVVGVAFTLANAVFIITIPKLYADGGPVAVFRFLVDTPFLYVPVMATFLSTYLAVEVLLPRRLADSDVNLDYLDPENLGGMRPVGELVKYAYYFLVVGLIAYAVATYGPHLLGGVFAYEGIPAPGPVVNAAFTLVWGVAVGTMVYGIYVLHQFMVDEKREELHRLDQLAREHIDQPWDIEQFDPTNAPEEYERYRQQVEHVTATREYPATFTMWSQLAVGVLLPKAIQLVLAGL